MSTNYDILCFLEYFSDRSSVVSGGKRTPTNAWQNFYQEGQTLGSADTESNSTYYYLAFDVDGFGSTEGSSINDLSVVMAATAELIDVTDSAMTADNLVIATLYVQTAGSSSFDASSAQRISRYIGSLEEASINDTVISWKVNPAINKLNPQVPTRKVSGTMLNKTRPQYL
jgi:hypothetical protein|tara:strand:+ start:239 stop:751 length:513 start_codon:yes stop_codon:yes gene_type:complete